MILSRKHILRELDRGDLTIDPRPPDSKVEQVSVNLRLGRGFTTFKELPQRYPAIRITDDLFDTEDLWEKRQQDSFFLEPEGGFVLGHTMERVHIPNHLMGFVEGRSSWARAGLSIHLTAPKIDPGFDGTITLEIVNLGKSRVELVAGEDEPAQLLLFQLSKPVDTKHLYGGRFQYQQEPVPSGTR